MRWPWEKTRCEKLICWLGGGRLADERRWLVREELRERVVLEVSAGEWAADGASRGLLVARQPVKRALGTVVCVAGTLSSPNLALPAGPAAAAQPARSFHAQTALKPAHCRALFDTSWCRMNCVRERGAGGSQRHAGSWHRGQPSVNKKTKRKKKKRNIRQSKETIGNLQAIFRYN